MAMLVFMLTACGSPTPKTILPSGQMITLSDSILHLGGSDTVRFGRMHAGEKVVKTLILHNTTQKTLVVVDYTRSCGCTTLIFDKQPIRSNTHRSMTISFDSQGLYGWQFKAIELKIAGAAAPLKIYIDAEVE